MPIEQNGPGGEAQDFSLAEKERARLPRRERLIRTFIENRVIAPEMDDDEFTDLAEEFQDMSATEKANLLFEKLSARLKKLQIIKETEEQNRERKEHGEEVEDIKPINPKTVARIRALWSDQEVQDIFVSRYSEAITDDRIFKLSELGSRWQNVNDRISKTEDEYADLNRSLFLQEINDPDDLSEARTDAGGLAKKLIKARAEKEAIVTLGGLPEVAENTDISAEIQYQTLVEYHRQAKEGFVWLPSRTKIHHEAVAALQNGRWPVLVGEAGTGKSEQAVAAAKELTGEAPEKLACSERTNENDIVGKTAMDESGQSFLQYGPVMKAISGCEDSRDETASHKGRIVRFDESGRLGNQGYATIKELRQLKPGDTFHGRKVLAGFSSIWTTNPTGPRYPDRSDPDPAMRREIAKIEVDYPDMTEEDPELYEFMLANLLDENNHIPVAQNELSPNWISTPVSGETLPDGREIVAKQEINPDRRSKGHGYLYRLSHAVKALQDSFVAGNAEEKSDELLRYSVDSSGKASIVENGGQPLELSTSTITLGEVASWMKGFLSREQKDNPDFQAKNISSWLQYKINLYLRQSDEEDRGKIQAIFDHFHLLDPVPATENSSSKPLTPKEIGYLSPRVKRPLEVKQPEIGIDQAESTGEKVPKVLNLQEYGDTEVLTVDGGRIRIKIGKGRAI